MQYRLRPLWREYEVQSYIHGEEAAPADAIDCSLGINPFGYTPTLTAEAYAETFTGISGYPSYPYPELRAAICEYLAPVAAIAPEQLAIHTGSMGMLIDLNRLLLAEGARVLCGEPTFSSATSDMRAQGAVLDVVPLREENNFTFSVAAFREALRPEHVLIYIDNPNNPTGQIIPLDELRELARQALAQDTVLLVDEAYGDFMGLENSAVTLVNDFPNVFVVKTLSKGFGLAGLRTGYAVLPREFLPWMHKLPGEMAITEAAARLTPLALRDTEHIRKSNAAIAENKARVLQSLRVLRASATGTTVPIVLLYTEKDVNLYSVLLRHGIIAERGEDFDGIGARHVRLRVPRDVEALLPRLAAAEAEVEAMA